jgi:hypothetical protein
VYLISDLQSDDFFRSIFTSCLLKLNRFQKKILPLFVALRLQTLLFIEILSKIASILVKQMK